MPEQPQKWPRGAAWTLTHAHDAGQVAGIRCNVTRYYKPLELREVIGNVTIDEVRGKVRCQQCKSREWMSAQLFHPTGEQAHTTPLPALGGDPMGAACHLARRKINASA